MTDDEYGDGEFEEFNEFDGKQLEDFENELAEEESSKKRKLFAIVGGLLVGVVATIIVVGTGPEEETVLEPIKPLQSEITETIAEPKPAKKEDVAAQEPEQAPKEIAKPEPAKEEAVKPEETVEVKEDIESQIAKLQEENLIGQDVDAPGMIPDKGEKSAEPEPKEQKPEVKPEPVTASIKPKKAPQVVEKTPQQTYSIHVLAITSATKARSVRRDLIQMGFDSWINRSKIKLNAFKVKSGRFKSVKEASRLLGHLANKGFHTRVSYIKGGKGVTIEAGVFSGRSQAENLVRKLRAAGFTSRIEKGVTSTTLYHVLAGKYKSRAAAKRVSGKIADAGYKTLKVVESK